MTGIDRKTVICMYIYERTRLPLSSLPRIFSRLFPDLYKEMNDLKFIFYR